MIETKRLKIRNFVSEDSKSCFESWGKDKDLGKYIIQYPMSEISEMELLVSSLEKNKHAWVLQDKISGNSGKRNNMIVCSITKDEVDF